jgi:hypothetical protein
MKIATKLIFGIRTSGSVSLSVTVDGQLPAQPPEVLITTCGQQDAVISCSNNMWVATLAAGDHVVRMPAPGDSWFDGPVTFTLSAPARIVIPGATASSPPLTWTGTVGTADTKNPWPPPLAGTLDADSLSDPTWLGTTLTTLGTQVSVDRSDPAHAPPARGPRRPRRDRVG